MHEWYAAPMEGLTGWRWRQVQHEMFGRAALYVTPFVSPNGNFSFQRKELEELSNDPKGAELGCHFCHQHYTFTPAQLKELLARATRP